MQQTIISQAESWPHRFDETSLRIGFIPVPRELHRKCTFITDQHLPPNLPVTPMAVGSVAEALDARAKAPHFVFHSAYCCSTMVARAFDIPGRSMGFKEPQILNDLVGWRRRGGKDDEVHEKLRIALDLLARPFEEGEVNVIKPSIIANPLAEACLNLNSGSKAIMLYAPIESYLQSIVKKGLWGRRWVREAFIATLADGALIGGFEDQNLLELTDLQIAAVGWISQLALFHDLEQKFGSDRVILQDSASLLSDTRSTMARFFDHLDLGMDEGELTSVLEGPAFTTHSKDASENFSAEDREREQEAIAELYSEEISMVAQWTRAVGANQGLKI
jgi:hypothetical protein